MKLRFILPLSFGCFGSAIFAQTTGSLNEALLLSRDDATGAFELSWHGREARTYFIQFSPDLTSGWHYLPVIEQGSGDLPIIYGFWIGDVSRSFFRLIHTDLPASDPYLSVFGGDGIPSGWKLENGLDPFADLTGIYPEGSDFTYWELYQMSLTGGAEPADENVAGLIVYTP